MGTFTIFYSTACSNTANMTTQLVEHQHHARIPTSDGGNPEVYNNKMNLCFSMKKMAKAQCLEQIYKNIDILVLQEKNDKPIVLAGRGAGKDKVANLKEEDKRVIIYIDSKNVKQPIKLNITPFKKSQNGDRVIFDIAKEDIKDTLTLRDREGKLLLRYKIIK